MQRHKTRIEGQRVVGARDQRFVKASGRRSRHLIRSDRGGTVMSVMALVLKDLTKLKTSIINHVILVLLTLDMARRVPVLLQQ
jgi:hypothetical protein